MRVNRYPKSLAAASSRKRKIVNDPKSALDID
jgi:hypothetical protein